jgi:hypothetical protein
MLAGNLLILACGHPRRWKGLLVAQVRHELYEVRVADVLLKRRVATGIWHLFCGLRAATALMHCDRTRTTDFPFIRASNSFWAAGNIFEVWRLREGGLGLAPAGPQLSPSQMPERSGVPSACLGAGPGDR